MLGPFFEPPVTEKHNAARRIVGERRCVSNRACERCHSTALKAAGLYDKIRSQNARFALCCRPRQRIACRQCGVRLKPSMTLIRINLNVKPAPNLPLDLPSMLSRLAGHFEGQVIAAGGFPRAISDKRPTPRIASAV